MNEGTIEFGSSARVGVNREFATCFEALAFCIRNMGQSVGYQRYFRTGNVESKTCSVRKGKQTSFISPSILTSLSHDSTFHQEFPCLSRRISKWQKLGPGIQRCATPGLHPLVRSEALPRLLVGCERGICCLNGDLKNIPYSEVSTPCFDDRSLDLAASFRQKQDLRRKIL